MWFTFESLHNLVHSYTLDYLEEMLNPKMYHLTYNVEMVDLPTEPMFVYFRPAFMSLCSDDGCWLGHPCGQTDRDRADTCGWV